MKKCYLCGNTFNNTNVKKHDEHIIQQAVGGNLTENDILCSTCGGKLGNNVDVPFNKIFDGISTRLDIKKDRVSDNKNTKAVQGKLGHIDIIWKDFKVFPSKPFHIYSIDKKIVVIYASEKIAKEYSKKVEKEIKDDFNKGEEPKIKLCHDMEGIIEFPFEMNDKYFKRGLAKIAIGFASKHNIKREDLPLVLDINKESNKAIIKDRIIAIPFYPLGIIDRLIEIQKNEFEHYPSHNMILFTINYDNKTLNGKKILICYIELFSTFQWYVILNEEYYGDPIYEYYAQQILKKDDYIVNLGRRYYKERNIWLQPLGISEEYIDKKYNNQKLKILSKLTWSIKSESGLLNHQPNIFQNLKSRFVIEEELIQEETIKQKYQFNFEGYLKNIISRITDQSQIFKNKERYSHIDNDVTKFLKNKFITDNYKSLFVNFEDTMNFKRNFDLFYKLDYEDNEIFSIYSFRVFYYENNELKNYYSELLENFKILDKRNAFKKYNHNKMYMLENYIQKNNTKQKTQQNTGIEQV